MINQTISAWETKRTEETRKVEDVLRTSGFDRVDAYRYNSASIRVRVIDPRFEGMSIEQRDEMVDQCLNGLPDRTQADIMNLLTFAPSEVNEQDKSFKTWLMNAEFEDPSPSHL